MSTTEQTFDTMQLPNVHAPVHITSNPTFRVSPVLDKVIKELALKNPLWQFKATAGGYSGFDSKEFYYSTRFEVFSQSEQLGTIMRTYSRRARNNEEAISLHSRSIEKSLTRKIAYVTVDPDKAIAKARKEFAPKSRKEKVNEAWTLANHGLYSLLTEATRRRNKITQDINEAALAFALSPEGMSIFTKYLEREQNVEVLRKISTKEEAHAEILTIANVKDKLGKEGTALVVLDEGKYLVKILDVVHLYDDTTLPEEFRGKLGMLKLVSENQFIADTGYRVSSEVFVISLS